MTSAAPAAGGGRAGGAWRRAADAVADGGAAARPCGGRERRRRIHGSAGAAISGGKRAAQAQAALDQATAAIQQAQAALRGGRGAVPGRAGGAGGRGATQGCQNCDIQPTPYTLDNLVTPQFTGDETFFEALFSGGPVTWADMKAKADRGEPLTPMALGSKVTVSIDNTYETVYQQLSRNVVGMVEGSDPKLKDTYIIYGAHLDHVGYSMTGGGNVGSTSGCRNRSQVAVDAMIKAGVTPQKAPRAGGAVRRARVRARVVRRVRRAQPVRQALAQVERARQAPERVAARRARRQGSRRRRRRSRSKSATTSATVRTMTVRDR
jgi:hypothetical protein